MTDKRKGDIGRWCKDYIFFCRRAGLGMEETGHLLGGKKEEMNIF